MTINKNFVVRNGLEVAQTLLCADDETNRVGINSANPEFELDLYGDLRIVGGLSVGGTTGRAGEYLESTGDALEWKAIPALRVVETYTAVSGQVTFPSTGFLPYAAADFIDVFVDGVKLAQDEFLTSTGNTRIELVAPALEGETVELIAYNASSIGVGGSGIQGITIGEEGVVVGTAGQVTNLNFVGASLTAIGSGAGVTVYFDNVVPGIATYASFSGVATYASSSGIASALTSTASVNTTGIITASRFVGDGSGLTGVTFSQWETSDVGIHTLSNVGIGTTSKSAFSLDTPGPVRVQKGDNVIVISSAGFTADGPEGRYLQLAYQTNPNYILNNVGIGTTNATSALTVQGDVSVSGVSTLGSLSINSSTITPSTTLTVAGNLFVNDDLTVNAGYPGIGVVIQGSDYGGQSTGFYRARVDDQGGNKTEAMVIGRFQNLSAYTLYNDGSILTNGDISLVNGASISVSGVSTLIGSVGIGTTNASSKLTVLGDFVTGDPNDGTSQFKVDAVGNASISPGRLLYLNGTNTNVGLKWTSGLGIELYNSSNLGGSDRNVTISSVNGGAVTLIGGGVGGTLRIDSSGLDVIGVTTSNFSGDVKVGVDTSSGVILTSPNGTRYRLIVDDSGNLSTTAV